MTLSLRVGYVPLADAALLIAAQRKGFAESHGLSLDLVRETSWANIRDKLALGYFDAAHRLAPAAIACSLGLGQVRAPLLAAVGLGLNGNAITVSSALYDELSQFAQGDLGDPLASARALRAVATARRLRNRPPLSFAHVFPFSSHHYQLRIWMRAGGVDPDNDVTLLVLPPPYMARSLEMGQVDGFCVGAPWNSVAVEAGAGLILHPCCEIVRDCPEKVLAMRVDWSESTEGAQDLLVKAISDASRWCCDPANREGLATLLANEFGQPVKVETLIRILAGDIETGRERSVRHVPGYLNLDAEAMIVSESQAAWIHAQMVMAGQTAYSAQQAEEARAVFCPTQSRSSTAKAVLPSAFAGPIFEPDDVRAFIRRSAAVY